jgi:hypothetical protein
MILEAFGGISPHSLHFIRRLALRATGARAAAPRGPGGFLNAGRNGRAPVVRLSFSGHGTVYGGFEHERQVVLRTPHAAAAQVGDAKGIRKKITEMKMRLIKDALI